MGKSLLYCVFLLLLQDCTRVATELNNSGPRVLSHRTLLTGPSTLHRILLSASSGPGLRALPVSAFTQTANGPLKFMSANSESPGIYSKSGCTPSGDIITTASIKRGRDTPVCTSADGSTVIWGNTARPASGGAVGTVYMLDDKGSCSYSYQTKLPDPTGLLPVDYHFRSDTDTKAPILSHMVASKSADVILVATAQPATLATLGGNTIVREAAAPLPYTLIALSYKKTLKPNSTRYTYTPAGILPIPAMPSQGGRVSGLSLSTDGSTALVCLMPRCGNRNPSSCGAGVAHVFRLTTDDSSNMDTLGGHQWTLMASLPFQGYGTAVGHGVTCSLSQDGTTAAVLTAMTTTIQLPTTANTSAGNVKSSLDISSSGSNNRRMQQLQPISDTNSSAAVSTGTQYMAVTTRSAHLQLYATASPGGSWAAVGSDVLATAIADCIVGEDPCRPVIAVTERFAAVGYRSGSDLKVEVVFHTAAQAASSGRRCEFTKICVLTKSLGQQQDAASALPAPGPSADLIAGVAVHQPPGTSSLKVQVTSRSPGAIWVWTLSRREDKTCPTTPKNLLEAGDMNSSNGDLPQLVTDTTADGSLVVFSGVPGDAGDTVFGVLSTGG